MGAVGGWVVGWAVGGWASVWLSVGSGGLGGLGGGGWGVVLWFWFSAAKVWFWFLFSWRVLGAAGLLASCGAGFWAVGGLAALAVKALAVKAVIASGIIPIAILGLGKTLGKLGKPAGEPVISVNP